VAYLETAVDPLFYINRLVDLCFAFDIYLNFRMAYYVEKDKKWVKEIKLVRKHYLYGWFPIDFFSTIPFDAFALLFKSDSVSSLKFMRMMKLLKLLKLLRVLKSMRIFKRLQAVFGLTNSSMSLIKFSMILATTIHALACFWRLVPAIESNEERNWIFHLAERRGLYGNDTALLFGTSDNNGERRQRRRGQHYYDEDHSPDGYYYDSSSRRLASGSSGSGSGSSSLEIIPFDTPLAEVAAALGSFELYAASLEYSFLIMALGFGETQPVTLFEHLSCIVCMLFAGAIYAFCIGEICGVISLRDPASVKFTESMDLLNRYLKDNHMPGSVV
jgi:hypothetical protein